MFVNPLFLWLLPLAALPVVIHMIHRQKYRVLPFSALLFFDRSRKFNVFRLRLRHILLMCLRILILLLVILAFARPGCTRLGVGDKHQAVVLVLDTSTSMTREFGDRTMLEFAGEQAVRSLEELAPGSQVGLVVNTQPPDVVVPLTSDPAAVREALTTLTPVLRRGSSWSAVAAARGMLENSRASSRQVVVFTDLQRSAWADGGDGRSPEQRKRAVPVQFVALGGPEQGNCGIVRVDAPRAEVLVGRPAKFSVVVRNFGEKAVKNLSVAAGLGTSEDREVTAESVRVDLPPEGTVGISFYFTFSMQGPQDIWFRTGDDALAADNRWVQAVRVGDSPPVLCLGEPKAMLHLTHALSPSGSARAMTLATSPFSQVAKTGLYGYQCVFLSAVAEMGTDERRLLREYVGRGGGLVVFLGQGTDEGTLRALVAADASGSIMPVTIEGAGDQPARIGRIDFGHSVVGSGLGGLADELEGVTYVRRYGIAAPADNGQVTALAFFEDGTPAVLEARYGFGRCVLFAGGCTPADSDLPFRAIFPVLMQELARRLAAPVRDVTREVRPGEVFIASFEEAERPREMLVLAPDEQRDTRPTHEGTTDFYVSFDRTHTLGYYQVLAKYEHDPGSETAVDAFAVNAAAEDSDLRAVSAAVFEERHAARGVTVTAVDGPVLQAGLLATDVRELMRLLLLVILAAVVAENVISWVTR